MRVLKNTITKRLAFLYLILLVFTGCTNDPDYSQGPCPFPPAESNLPVITDAYDCEGCYFNIEFREGEYSFAANQLMTLSRGLSEAHNSFFSFYFANPSSVEEFYNSIGEKTPMLKVDAVFNSDPDSSPPVVSAAIGIYNYCEDLFEPITGDVSQSWHQLTNVELIESYPVERDSEPYQLNYFYSYGELVLTFQIDEELEKATANYKIETTIYEKL